MKKWFAIPILFLPFMTAGCSQSLRRPERPTPHYSEHWEERERVSPVVVAIGDNDKIVVVEERERELIAGREIIRPIRPQRTIIQRIGYWIAGLSLIYVIIGLVLGPGVVVSIIVWKIRIARRMKRAVVEIVSGIKKSEMIRSSPRLHNKLKEETSAQTKKIIGEIKAGL